MEIECKRNQGSCQLKTAITELVLAKVDIKVLTQFRHKKSYEDPRTQVLANSQKTTTYSKRKEVQKNGEHKIQ